MSQRTLLVAALALMAGGLLLGGIGVVTGGAAGVESRLGPRWQEGPDVGPAPRRPGFGPGRVPGEGPWKRIPGPTATPAAPTPTPSPPA